MHLIFADIFQTRRTLVQNFRLWSIVQMMSIILISATMVSLASLIIFIWRLGSDGWQILHIIITIITLVIQTIILTNSKVFRKAIIFTMESWQSMNRSMFNLASLQRHQIITEKRDKNEHLEIITTRGRQRVCCTYKLIICSMRKWADQKKPA